MSEDFKAITTQQQFDEMVSKRLERERSVIENKYSDYETLKNENAQFKEQLNNLQNLNTQATESVTELTNQVNALTLEKTRLNVAISSGLPLEMASRLQGASEEELKNDAEKLKGLFTPKINTVLPTKTNEVKNEDTQKTELRNMLKRLKERSN